MRKSCFIVLILLSACIGLSSCKGINRGEGYPECVICCPEPHFVVLTIRIKKGDLPLVSRLF